MHPVRKFIEQDLKTNTNEFSNKIGKAPTSINSWYSRNTKVEKLPIWIALEFSKASGLSIDKVIKLLKKYELEGEG